MKTLIVEPKILTQEYLKSLFYYDPLTGNFTRKISRSGVVKVGDIAGSKDSGGYLVINIDSKPYRNHRLAFLYMEGYFPENDVDHINRIRDDNRWDNLREVSRSCNVRNKGMQSNNTSGVIGVSPYIDRGNWRATIRANNKQNFLGFFDNFEDAVKARWQAEIKYGFPNCNSTSSAYQYLVEHDLL